MTTYRKKSMPTMAEIRRNPPPGAKGHKAQRKRAINKDGTPRKRPVDWEGQEQAVLMRWLLGEHKNGTPVGELWPVTYHVPNGGQRHKATAAQLKGQGVKSGVSDLVVMEPRGGHHGLYLEFKATPPHHAALQESQRDWLKMAEARGYCAVLARGVEEAKAVLQWYAQQSRTISTARWMCDLGTEWRKEDAGDDNDAR